MAIRLVCRRCRKRLDVVDDVDELYTQRVETGRRGVAVEQELSRRAWRCPRCRRGNYPVTLERMRTEYGAAVERGDHVIELPLV